MGYAERTRVSPHRRNFFSRPWLGLAEKVGAKHSDRKSTVSAIGYARMLRPHRTRADEQSQLTENNERLEFLGDAILAFLVGEPLYQKYPAMNEAELTSLRSNLVKEEKLAQLGIEIGGGDSVVVMAA